MTSKEEEKLWAERIINTMLHGNPK